ncbi:MAG: Fic family protein [Clostridium sp.]
MRFFWKTREDRKRILANSGIHKTGLAVGKYSQKPRYIPPNPEDMLTAMSDLEKYINSDDTLDPLIQAALIHYQFETTHPFLDGNGRVGRLLITLFLMEKGILSTPALYISYYLKMNRIEYYDRMTQVRRTGDYEQWISFFLQACRFCRRCDS